jgi:hypothetical protein
VVRALPEPRLEVWIDGTPPLADAEKALVGRRALGTGGEPCSIAAPLSFGAAPRERALTLQAIGWPEGASDGALVGWHAGGAAWVERAGAPLAQPPHPMAQLLKQRLDPAGRFLLWKA